MVDEIMTWLDQESDWYVNELIGEYRAPFAAQISQSELLATYRRMFYKSDNEGNIQYDKPDFAGRERLFNLLSLDDYLTVAKAVGPKGGIEYMQTLDGGITASEEFLGDRNAEI